MSADDELEVIMRCRNCGAQGPVGEEIEHVPPCHPKIDTMNKFLVGVGGAEDQISIMRPVPVMSRADAVNLAAWLKVLADPLDETFSALVAAIEAT